MFYPLGLLFGLSDHSKNIHKWDTLLVLWSCLLIILMVAFVTVLFQHVVKLPGHLLKEETVVSFFRDSSSPDEDGFVTKMISFINTHFNIISFTQSIHDSSCVFSSSDSNYVRCLLTLLTLLPCA